MFNYGNDCLRWWREYIEMGKGGWNGEGVCVKEKWGGGWEWLWG